jgi:hypothetical protein
MFLVFDFAERKFAAGSSSCRFAGSETGEQEFALRFSAEIFGGRWFERLDDLWPNTALEPTAAALWVCD